MVNNGLFFLVYRLKLHSEIEYKFVTFLDLTEITVEGDNKTNMETLIKNIGYSNSREFPTPGRRNLHLTSSIS